MHNALKICWLLVLGATTLGCGSSAVQVQSRETASKSFQAGITALENREYQSAVDNLSAALEGGWLGYSTVTAYTKRAIAQAALGNFDQAHADLDYAQAGEGASAETYVARTFVFEKQGKQKEAKAAWKQARRLDRNAKKIKE